MGQTKRSLMFIVVFLIAIPVLTFAQDMEEVQKKTKVQDDLEFAMTLARFRYFDLASEYAETIKKGRMTPEDEATLLLTNAQILRWAAEFSSSRNDSAAFYAQAIERFKEFTEYHTDHPDYNTARVDLAVLYQSHGQFLSDEMNLTQDPERRKTQKTAAEESFREGTILFNEVSRDLRKRADVYTSNEQLDEAHTCIKKANEAVYKKGVAYYHWALIYGEGDFNREDYLTRTVETLDEYIWEAEEGDFWALWSYLYQSKAYTELGEYTAALDLATQVFDPETGLSLIDPEKDKFDENFSTLAPQYLKMITDLVESAYTQAALIHNRQANYDKTVSTTNELKSLFTKCELDLSPIGDRALLEQSEAYVCLGKINLASEVAKTVADRNPANNVGRDAKRALNDIIKKQMAESPGSGKTVSIDPAILYSAAEGAYLEKNYLQAVNGYYKVFRALNTVDQERSWEAKTWGAIGKCFEQLGRHLEASIAYKTGFYSKYAKANEDDYESSGNRWYLTAGKRFKATQHPFDEAIMKNARETLVTAGVSTDLLYFIAKEKFDRAQIAADEERSTLMNEAIESFLDVKKTSKFYEKSLIYLARCYQDLAKYEDALKRLDEFDDYVRRTPAPGGKGRGARQGAMAEALFYRAEIYLVQEKYQDAFNLLKGFEETFKSQQGFFAAIIYFRILAQIGLEDFTAAEILFKKMKETYSTSTRYPVAAYRIGKAFVVAAETERGDTSTEPTRKYLDYLKKGADYMYQYCEMSGFDSFTNLKNVADWYKELAEFKTSADVYMKIVKEFGRDAAYKNEIESDVFRAYGEVLLELKDFQTAKPIWLKLLSADTKNTTVLYNTARCLGGWLEYDGTNYIEIPGSGDYVPPPDADPKKLSFTNALGIWKYMLRALKVNKAYEPEWWEAKLFTIWCYYKAGETDPDTWETALKLIKNVELYHPDLGGLETKRAFKYIRDRIKNKKAEARAAGR